MTERDKEYISKADVLSIVELFLEGDTAYSLRRRISMIPAADVRSVVPGQWIMSEDRPGYAVCSNCHDFYIDPEFMHNGKWNHCPNCGADMGGKADV